MSRGIMGAIIVSALCLLVTVVVLLFGEAEGGRSPTRNEPSSTRSPAEQLKHLCPELAEDDIDSVRYDKNGRKCYRIGEKGPCGNNMIFYNLENDQIHGYCDCDKTHSRMLIYYKQDNQCYFIFQQGYCNPGKWVDVRRDGTPTCQRNRCTQTGSSSAEFVPYKNWGCVELNEPHPKSNCTAPFGRITFKRNVRLPTCVVSSLRAVSVPPSACPPGSVHAIGGLCQPTFDFD